MQRSANRSQHQCCGKPYLCSGAQTNIKIIGPWNGSTPTVMTKNCNPFLNQTCWVILRPFANPHPSTLVVTRFCGVAIDSHRETSFLLLMSVLLTLRASLVAQVMGIWLQCRRTTQSEMPWKGNGDPASHTCLEHGQGGGLQSQRETGPGDPTRLTHFSVFLTLPPSLPPPPPPLLVVVICPVEAFSRQGHPISDLYNTYQRRDRESGQAKTLYSPPKKLMEEYFMSRNCTKPEK